MKTSMRSLRCLGAAALLCTALLSSSGEPAKPSAETQSTPPASPDAVALPAADIDVCSLISDEQIESITGTRPLSKKNAQTVSDGLRVSQCYIGMATAAESIVLAVFQRGETNGPSPRAMWKRLERGGDEGEQEGEGAEESEAGEKKTEPEKIAGLGEEAFIMPQRFGATIYTLDRQNVVRLSIGGGGGDLHEKKVATLKAIAEAVLPKL